MQHSHLLSNWAKLFQQLSIFLQFQGENVKYEAWNVTEYNFKLWETLCLHNEIVFAFEYVFPL